MCISFFYFFVCPVPIASSYSGGRDDKADYFQHGDTNCWYKIEFWPGREASACGRIDQPPLSEAMSTIYGSHHVGMKNTRPSMNTCSHCHEE